MPYSGAVSSLSFTALVVEDLDKMSAFYAAVCGLVEARRAEQDIAGRRVEEVIFDSDPPDTGNFVLIKFLDSVKRSNQDVILGFVTDDIVAFVDRVRKAGGAVLREPYVNVSQGLKAAFITDVEGNVIEAVEIL
jgi:lactoylglutathione lyase